MGRELGGENAGERRFRSRRGSLCLGRPGHTCTPLHVGAWAHLHPQGAAVGLQSRVLSALILLEA